jgi:hypothetical protein
MFRKFLAAGCFLLSVFAPVFANAETLTNQTVIALTRAGLGPETVIAKIRSSTPNFDTSTEGLIALKQANVSDSVIAAMFSASAGTASSASAATTPVTDPADLRSPRPSGIYTRSEWESTPRMIKLDPTSSSETRSSGRLASAFTYGLAKIKAKTVLPTPSARIQVSTARPSFYFYFDQTATSLSQGGNSSPFAALLGQQSQSPVTSPNEFALIKFQLNGTNREIEVGSANIMGSSGGVASSQRIDFTYEDVGPGIYKVTPQVDLVAGEYGFIYAAGGGGIAAVYGMGGGQTSKVFDFGVR